MDYKKSIQIIKELLELQEEFSLSKNDEEQIIIERKNLYQDLFVCYNLLYDFDNCESVLKNAQHWFTTNSIPDKNKTKWSSWLKKHKKELASCQHEIPIISHSDQAKQEQIQKYQQLYKKTEYIKNASYFIVSKKWINQWKQYTGFNKLGARTKKVYAQNAKIEIEIGEEEEEAKSKTKKGQENNILQEQLKYPGPLSNNDIIDFETQILPDFRSDEYYSCIMLKQDLKEGQDFVVIGQDLWQYFYQIYKGVPIQRFANEDLNNPKNIKLEINLMEIKFVIVPVFTQLMKEKNTLVDQIQISKFKSVNELKYKLLRVSNYFLTEKSDKINLENINCRIWIVNGTLIDISQLIDDVQDQYNNNFSLPQSEYQFMHIEGKILHNDQILHEVSLNSTDVLIVELFLEQKWIFENQKEENDAKNRQQTIQYNQQIDQLISKKKINIFQPNQMQNKQARYGLCGLFNLGNTCYMNSALQGLLNTPQFIDYMLDNLFIKDINFSNPYGLKGELATKFSEIVKQMWQGSNSQVSPYEIKKLIMTKASSFIGHCQSDPQEFLSCIIDCLHEDLNRKNHISDVKGIISKNDKPDEYYANFSWEEYIKQNQSIITELFCGQFKSKLTCPQCHQISITFDPFTLISLPIQIFPYSELQQFQVYFVQKGPQLPLKLTVTMAANCQIIDLKQLIAQKYNIPDYNQIEICLLRDFDIQEFEPDNKTIQYLNFQSGIPFAYDLYSMYDIQLDQFQKKINQDQKDNSQPKKKVKLNQQIQYKNEGIVLRINLKSNYQNQIQLCGFTRLLYLHKQQTLSNEDLHLQLYFLLRRNLQKLIKSLNSIKNKNIFYSNFNSAQLTENGKNLKLHQLSHFTKEYTFIQNNNKLYNIFIVSPKLSNGSKEIEFNQEKIEYQELLSYCQDINQNHFYKKEIEHLPKILNIDVIFNIKEASEIKKLMLNQYEQSEIKKTYKKTNNQQVDLWDCLRLFSQEEKLDEFNEWHCSNCQKHQRANKTIELYKTPPYLILHLKRFKSHKVLIPYQQQNGQQNNNEVIQESESLKLQTHVNIPLTLDLTNFVLQYQKKNSKQLQLNYQKKILKYELYSVINHVGKHLKMGHCTNFSYNTYNKAWYSFNDEHVKQINVDDINNENAYVLFYQLCKENQ